jgi:hypothetical protein
MHTERPGIDAHVIGVYESVSTDIKRVRAASKRFDGGCDIFRAPDFDCGSVETERAGRRLNLSHFQRGGRIADIGHDRQPAQTRKKLS